MSWLWRPELGSVRYAGETLLAKSPIVAET
jgi:hypothetical protein